MRILHVLAGAWPGSGIAEAVAGLSCALKARGHDVAVATLAGPLACSMVKARTMGVRVEEFRPCRPLGLFFSSEMRRRLGSLVRAFDVVHVHGAWTFPVWWACHCALLERKSLVMSPHGSYEPARLRHGRWKKRLAGLLDRYYLRRADVHHVTCAAEAEDVVSYAGEPCRKKIAVIANGVEVEKLSSRDIQGDEGTLMRSCDRAVAGKTEADSLGALESTGANNVLLNLRTNGRPRAAGRMRTALYVGRLHPLKGLDMLVDAWKLTVANYPDWRLLVIGPDEQGTQAGLCEQAKRLKLDNQITFGGPLYGDEKARVMAAADLLVLPTLSENFGIVVAEALALGVPVITTKGAPWQELLGGSEGRGQRSETGTDNRRGAAQTGRGRLTANDRCGWWVDIGVGPLAVALKEAMSLTDEQRHALGANGRKLVEEKYAWPKIASEMESVYETSLKGARQFSQ